MKGGLKTASKNNTSVSKSNSIQSFFSKPKKSIDDAPAEFVDNFIQDLTSQDTQSNPISFTVGIHDNVSSEAQLSVREDSSRNDMILDRASGPTPVNTCSLQALKVHPLFLGKSTTINSSKTRAEISDTKIVKPTLNIPAESVNGERRQKRSKSNKIALRPSPKAPADLLPSPEQRSASSSPAKMRTNVTNDPIRSEKKSPGKMSGRVTNRAGHNIDSSLDDKAADEQSTSCKEQGSGENGLVIDGLDSTASSNMADISSREEPDVNVTAEPSSRPRRQAVLNTLARQEQLKRGIYEPDEDDFVQGRISELNMLDSS